MSHSNDRIWDTTKESIISCFLSEKTLIYNYESNFDNNG